MKPKRGKSMKHVRHKDSPFAKVDLAGASKTGLRTQFGALCYRVRKGRPEILLVTSRRTRRWIIPKGWPMDGMTPTAAAAREAFEEAGVEGKMHTDAAGLYVYVKSVAKKEQMPCAVLIYPLKVKTVHGVYPEKGQRKRKWFRPEKAAKLVDDPVLAEIVRNFDPRKFIKA